MCEIPVQCRTQKQIMKYCGEEILWLSGCLMGHKMLPGSKTALGLGVSKLREMAWETGQHGISWRPEQQWQEMSCWLVVCCVSPAITRALIVTYTVSWWFQKMFPCLLPASYWNLRMPGPAIPESVRHSLTWHRGLCWLRWSALWLPVSSP